MFCRILMSAIPVIWGVISAIHAWGMGTPEDQGEDIFSLGEVVVSGRLDSIEAAETVHVIKEDEIKKSSARTLDEALVLLSDVNVQVGNEGVPRVDIRGFKNRHVLFLLDGIPMNSAFDQQFDPSTIPVENIAEIKVTAGASSVLYGQGGLGGVINIITKKGRKGFRGNLGFESGDGSPYSTKASVSGAKGKFDFFASGNVFRRDNFPLAKDFHESYVENAGYRINSDNTRDNAFINIGFNPRNELYIALTGNWVQGGYGKPASAINNSTNKIIDPYAPMPKYGRVDWYGGYSLQLAADYDASKMLNIKSMIYYNRIDQDNNQYDDESYKPIAVVKPDGNYVFLPDGNIMPVNKNVPNSYMYKNRGVTRGASIQPKYDFGRAGLVTLGFSGEWDTWIFSGIGKPDNGQGSPPYEIEIKQNHKDVYIYSAAIEYQVLLLQNLGFAAGYAHYWQHRDEMNTDDYSVSASTYYDIFKGTRLKAAFQRNIRFPSISQLYMKDSDNPYLAKEKAFHYQLGVEQKLPFRSSLKVDGFRSDLYNFIALDQSVNPPKNKNFPLYRFLGVETELTTNFMRNLTLKAGYTFLKSQDLSGIGRDEVQYVPRDKWTFIGKYDFDFGLTPFVSVIYVADSYVYSKQQIPTVYKHMMANYTVVNLKLTQNLYKNKLSLYIGADNIFNKDYEQSYGIPRPGRFIFGGVEYRFSI